MATRDRHAHYPCFWRFRRSWIAITVLLVMDAIFLVPAVTTFIQASGEWSRLDSLFDLTGAVFLSAWLLGWSMAPLIMTAILVMMLLGRETLRIRPGVIEVCFGLPFIGLVAIYDVAKMRNLRLEDPSGRYRGVLWTALYRPGCHLRCRENEEPPS